MHLLARLDIWLLDQVFQRIANFFHDHIGVRSRFCGYVCLIASLVVVAVDTGGHNSALSRVFAIIGTISVIRDMQKHPEPRIGFANQYRLSLANIRMFLIVAAIVFLPSDINQIVNNPLRDYLPSIAYQLLVTSAIYLISCTDRPRVQRRRQSLVPVPS